MKYAVIVVVIIVIILVFSLSSSKADTNQSSIDAYNKGKLLFLNDLTAYWQSIQPWGDQPLGNVSYVRTSSMYSNAFGTRAKMLEGGHDLKEGFNSDTVYRGTFADMANYIMYELTTARGIDGNAHYGINHDQATAIIEAYVKAMGLENTLGRGGPTCAYSCSVLKAINWSSLLSLVKKNIPLIAGFVAAPATGGASLVAALPSAADLLKSIV